MKFKSIALLFVLCLCFSLVSCSKENDSSSGEELEQLLTGRVWAFQRFEVQRINGSTSYSGTVQDVEDRQNTRFFNQLLVFRPDGTGTVTYNSGFEQEIKWKFNLPLRLEISEGYIENLNYQFSLSEEELILSSNSFDFQYQNPSTGDLGEFTFEGRIIFN